MALTTTTTTGVCCYRRLSSIVQLFLILFSVVVLFFSTVLSSRNNVTVQKCCPFGQTLNLRAHCERPITATTWNVKMFNPAKKTIQTRTTLPTNWQLLADDDDEDTIIGSGDQVIKRQQRPQQHYQSSTSRAIRQLPCVRAKLLSASQANYVLVENGSLYVVEYSRVINNPADYCLDYTAAMACLDDERMASVDGNGHNGGQPAELNHVVRVRKCCGTDGVFSTTNQSCVYLRDAAYTVDVGRDKTLVAGFPHCANHRVALLGKLHEAILHENGSLWLRDHKIRIPVDNYCLEHVLEYTGRSPSIMVCQEHLPPSIVSVEPTGSRDLRFTLYPIGLALSAVFLAATLVAGSLLPASHHVLHWRCQTNHVACLLLGDILLCITHLSNRMAPTPCFMIAVSMHFLFLAAFFWLNTMCFNIWWTFRDLRPQSVEKGQERCRLRLYEIYAWGGPLLIAGTAAILDSIPDSDNYTFLKPKFGTSTCWFHGNLEILTFFFGPVGVLLVINLTLFAATARELTCGLWKRELVKSNTERAALGRVCMKLVVVMGVTWIADLVSWIVGGPQELWYLTDLINCLQGVFIFIVVGCQPQVLASIKRLWCLRKHRENGTASTTNHHSSSSQGIPSMGDTITNNSVTNNTTKSIVPLETSC